MRKNWAYLIVIFGLSLMLLSCCRGDIKIKDTQIAIQNNKLDQNRIEQLKYNNVGLIYYNSDSQRFDLYCSGFWISPQLILTAAHCEEDTDLEKTGEIDLMGKVVRWVSYDDYVGILQAPRKIRRGKIVKYNHLVDLIEIKEENFDVGEKKYFDLKYAGNISVGDKVIGMGNPKGKGWVYNEGYVQKIWEHMPVEWKDSAGLIQVRMGLNRGNSGGAVYNEKMELVGIAHSCFVDEEGCLLTNADKVRGFLE